MLEQINECSYLKKYSIYCTLSTFAQCEVHNTNIYLVSIFRKRKDLDESKCKRYEKSVNDVMTIIGSMINPFETDQEELLALASGVMVDNNVADTLLSAEKLGEQQFVEFASTQLLGENPDVFTKLKRNNIKTFSSSNKATVKDSKGKEISVKLNRNLFAQLLVIARSRKVDLKEVMTYSLGVYPLSLATASGGLVKTAKSKLFKILEGEAGNPDVDVRSFHNNALIVDAMAVIQSIKGKWKTFGELSDSIFSSLIKLAQHWNATRLDFVVDRYPALSIKNTERRRRAEAGVQKVRIFNKGQNVPKQWKKYLSCGENKESLMEFLREHWSTCKSSQLVGISMLYVTSREKCYVLSHSVAEDDLVCSNEISVLESNHEEADTRMLLHAKHAAATYDRVIIKSPDTDVFILCLAIQQNIGKDVFMMTGTGNKFRCIPISTICDSLVKSFADACQDYMLFDVKL